MPFNFYAIPIFRITEIIGNTGPSTAALVRALVSTVFASEPRYWDDLGLALETMSAAFRSIHASLSAPSASSVVAGTATTTAPKTVSGASGPGSGSGPNIVGIENLRARLLSSYEQMLDVAHYIVDTIETLGCFLAALSHPQAARICVKTGFLLRYCTVYITFSLPTSIDSIHTHYSTFHIISTLSVLYCAVRCVCSLAGVYSELVPIMKQAIQVLAFPDPEARYIHMFSHIECYLHVQIVLEYKYENSILRIR